MKVALRVGNIGVVEVVEIWFIGISKNKKERRHGIYMNSSHERWKKRELL
jgi:hypothetical protein